MIPEGHQERLSGDARLELAALCRRVIDELASSTADSTAFLAAGELLRDAVEVLEAATHGRPYAGGEASMANYQRNLFIDHSPFSGWLNPLAPPMTLTSDGTEVVATVTFGAAYEGPPGHVHGGYVAAAFDEVLGFRARNEDVGRDAEVAAVEFLVAGDVLCRLAFDALVEIAAVVDPPQLDQFFVAMRNQPHAVMLRGVREQNFGGEPRLGDTSLFEEPLSLQ